MKCAACWMIGLAVIALLPLAGCSLRRAPPEIPPQVDLAHYRSVATEIDFPDVGLPQCGDTLATPAPITIDQDAPVEYWSLSLQEAVGIGLANSKVLRDLGGLVLQSPQSVQTIQSPMIQETNPQIGVEAALSAFDASLRTRAVFDKNDRPLNNFLFSGGTTFKQDLASMEVGVSKRAVTGSEFGLKHSIDYDFNNTPGNPFPSFWLANIVAEVRHPLLQGAGVDFNRIAGPNAIPGVYTGVLIARVNTDISLVDFEIGVRNLVADIETQYWELYYAYRDLDAKLAARDRALETWRRIYALFETGRLGGEAEKEAQARAQYFRFEEEVQNALTGRQFQKARTIAFAFRGANGVHENERELRLLMGVPLADGRLIRPAEEPTHVRVLFDWEQILTEAIAQRPELRRQRWQVKRREMELAASRNFLLPQLDAFGRYRWLGFGQDLLNATRQSDRFDNAYQSLTSGDFQEWQMGVEMDLPLGLRRGHAAVRHAELQLARERALLDAQERDVTHDLASTIGEMKRAFAVAQTNFNRRQAAAQQLAALEAVYEDADENQKTRLLDLILNAQSDLANAESGYYRGLSEYTLAIAQVHFQKGSLLAYDQVGLAEGPWPGPAYVDAAERAVRRVPAQQCIDYVICKPPAISVGPAAVNGQLPAAEPLLPATAAGHPSNPELRPLPPVHARDTGHGPPPALPSGDAYYHPEARRAGDPGSSVR